MAALSRTIALAAALVPLAAAFQDTVPAVAWASHSSGTLDSLAAHAPPFAGSLQFFDALLAGDDLCRYDAVVVAEQPGLHAADLRALPPSSYVAARLGAAASAVQVPYLPHAGGADALEHFKRSLAERCGARRVEVGLAQGGVRLHAGEKHVVCVRMPPLAGERGARSAALREHDAQLARDIARVAAAFPAHLVVYAGASPLTRRQAAARHMDLDVPVRPALHAAAGDAPAGIAPVNATLAQGGLFQRYQFFTPGLITALLVTFWLLVPVVMLGVYALASIQSPLRLDAPRGPSLEKKTQ